MKCGFRLSSIGTEIVICGGRAGADSAEGKKKVHIPRKCKVQPNKLFSKEDLAVEKDQWDLNEAGRQPFPDIYVVLSPQTRNKRFKFKFGKGNGHGNHFKSGRAKGYGSHWRPWGSKGSEISLGNVFFPRNSSANAKGSLKYEQPHEG